jgi:hypothetical protein
LSGVADCTPAARRRQPGSRGTLARVRERAEIERATLRGAAALDAYDPAPPFDSRLDAVSDAYLEEHSCGLAHLDADSWLYYLPLVLVAALARAGETGSMLVERVVWSLRPPDRDPPRLARLSREQEAAVAESLEYLGFHPDSRNQDLALQVLEEYWIPGASYR